MVGRVGECGHVLLCEGVEALGEFLDGVAGLEAAEFGGDDIDEHFPVLEAVEHGHIAVVLEAGGEEGVVLVVEAVDPGDDALVVGLDDVEGVLGGLVDELVGHVVLVEVEVGHRDVVIGKAHLIGYLVEVGQGVEVEFLLVVDGRAVVEDDVPVGAVGDLQQVYVHLQQDLLRPNVALAPLILDAVQLLLQDVGPPQVKGQHLPVLELEPCNVLLLHYLHRLPSLLESGVGLFLVSLLLLELAAGHRDLAVSHIDVPHVLLDVEIFPDQLEEPLEVGHGLIVVLLVEEAAADVVVQFEAFGLTFECFFVLLYGLIDVPKRLIVVAEAGVDHRLLLLRLDLLPCVLKVLDGLVVSLLEAQQVANGLVPSDADAVHWQFPSILPEVFLVKHYGLVENGVVLVDFQQCQSQGKHVFARIRILDRLDHFLDLLLLPIFDQPQG